MAVCNYTYNGQEYSKAEILKLLRSTIIKADNSNMFQTETDGVLDNALKTEEQVIEAIGGVTDPEVVGAILAQPEMEFLAGKDLTEIVEGFVKVDVKEVVNEELVDAPIENTIKIFQQVLTDNNSNDLNAKIGVLNSISEITLKSSPLEVKTLLQAIKKDAQKIGLDLKNIDEIPKTPRELKSFLGSLSAVLEDGEIGVFAEVYDNFFGAKTDKKQVTVKKQTNKKTPKQIINSVIDRVMSNMPFASVVKGNSIQTEASLEAIVGGVQNQIIGEKGANNIEQYKQSLDIAKQLEKEDKGYSETGWYKNNENQWKYFSNEYVAQFKLKSGAQEKVNEEQNLVDVLEDNIIFQAYPQLKKLKVTLYDSKYQGVSGAVSTNGMRSEGHIYINTQNRDGKSTEAILGHELNHELQAMEQFSNGSQLWSTLVYAINITGATNSGTKDLINYLNNFNTGNLSPNDRKIVEKSVEMFEDYSKNDLDKARVHYERVQGEIDSRAVELAIELKNDGKRYTYQELVNKVMERDGINPSEVVELYFKGFNFDTPKNNNVKSFTQGFVHDNVVYLNTDKMDVSTPIHEVGHLWLNWAKENAPQTYSKGMSLAMSDEAQPYIDKISELYPELEVGSVEFREEIVASMVGDQGESIVNSAQKESIKEWLKELWQSIKESLGINDFTAEEISNMNLEQFSKAVAVELLSEKRMYSINTKESAYTMFDKFGVLPLSQNLWQRTDANEKTAEEAIQTYSELKGISLQDAKNFINKETNKIDISDVESPNLETLQKFVVYKELLGSNYEQPINAPSVSEMGNGEQETSEMQTIKDNTIANGTFMLAPNGQPTNLNEAQFLQVRTEAFKNWFGDWQNDPANASKVVDSNGEPLIIYHGTKSSFNEFLTEKTKEGVFHFGTKMTAKERNDFSQNREGVLIPVFLSIRNLARTGDEFEGKIITVDKITKLTKDFNLGGNLTQENQIITRVESMLKGNAPKIFKFYQDMLGFSEQDTTNYIADTIIKLKEKRSNPVDLSLPVDGAVYKNIEEGIGDDSYIAFKPNQIKSATENTGQFSTNNNDIRYQKATNEDIVAETQVKILEADDNFYKNLKITENGLELVSNDAITIAEVKEQIENYPEIKNYFNSKLISPITFPNELKEEYISEQQQRDYISNYPQTLPIFTGMQEQLESGYIKADSQEQYLRTNKGLYENVGNSIFAPMSVNKTDFKVFNLNEAPQPYTGRVIKVKSEESVAEVSNKFSKVEEKNIDKNHFDCI